MYWSTTTFKVVTMSPELTEALQKWRDHVSECHATVREVRCYRFNAGTTVVWQEGFENFHDYQDLIEEIDQECERILEAVFRHAVPGSREGAIWSDVF